MKYKSTRTGIPRQDLAQDRAFWRDLLAQRTGLRGLPAHSAGGYRNRRFAIIRDAAWITLYRAKLPFPQVGVFLRCTGLAGEAFFTLADRARPEIEPRLRAEFGPDAAMEWGTSHHPGMTDIAAILAAPLPWDDSAAEQQIAWMLRVGAAWWNCFASLAGGPEVNDTSPAKRATGSHKYGMNFRICANGLPHDCVTGAKPRARRCSMIEERLTEWPKSATVAISDRATTPDFP